MANDADRIRDLNAEFRRTLVGGRVGLTAGMEALSDGRTDPEGFAPTLPVTAT